MGDWDDDDSSDGEFGKVTLKTKGNDWDDDDDSDGLKEEWDASSEDEEEAKKKAEAEAATAKAAAPKKVLKPKDKAKLLKAKLAAKDAEERKRAEAEAERRAEMTPEELAAEKLAKQKMVEDADAENMRDAFSGVVDDVPDETETVTTFGNIKNPTTEKEVSKFVNLFSDRLKTIEAENEELYLTVMKEMLVACCKDMNPDETKQMQAKMTMIHNNNVKAQKSARGDKKKKKAKGPSATSGKKDKMDGYDVFGGGGGGGGYGDYDDFM